MYLLCCSSSICRTTKYTKFCCIGASSGNWQILPSIWFTNTLIHKAVNHGGSWKWPCRILEYHTPFWSLPFTNFHRTWQEESFLPSSVKRPTGFSSRLIIFKTVLQMIWKAFQSTGWTSSNSRSFASRSNCSAVIWTGAGILFLTCTVQRAPIIQLLNYRQW